MRCFAIIPACGLSLRMGRPKLLLPLEGRPLIAHVLAAWREGGVSAVAVVVRPDDAELVAVVRETGVDVVTPAVPPPDMKASVQAGLRHLRGSYAPAASDAFLVAPADIPRLSPPVIRALIVARASNPDTILVPTLAGRRGHPVLYPWPLAEDVFALGNDEGLKALAQRRPLAEVPCDSFVAANSGAFADLDTPEQYRAAGGEYGEGY